VRRRSRDKVCRIAETAMFAHEFPLRASMIRSLEQANAIT
jgi:hypothetical protein